MQTQQIPNKKLAIAIGPIPYSLPDRPDFPLITNDFDIDRDDKHDLLLLKIKMGTITHPLTGESRDFVWFSNNTGGTLGFGNASFANETTPGTRINYLRDHQVGLI